MLIGCGKVMMTNRLVYGMLAMLQNPLAESEIHSRLEYGVIEHLLKQISETHEFFTITFHSLRY